MEEEEDKKPAAEDRTTRPQKTKLQNTKLQGHIVSKQEVNLIAKKAGDNNEVWDETWSLQWGGTVPVHKRLLLSLANHLLPTEKRMTPLAGYKSKSNVILPDDQIKEELGKAFCSMEDATEITKEK